MPRHPLIPSSPKNSPKQPIGSSDGRCVQGTGTESAHLCEVHLLDIPCSWGIVPSLNPSHDGYYRVVRSLNPTNKKKNKFSRPVLSESTSVVRVRPRASKGITDLLLPLPSFDFGIVNSLAKSLNRREERKSPPQITGILKILIICKTNKQK